ncbi:MAG: single-stranded DNA-binding protein [Phycisphaerales bacterium]|nr:single-stranded DNA-binding protein [Phycisphaerales bacterium]
MANFNRVMLMGNLTRDPQLKYLTNQTPVVDFGLAVNRRFTSNGEQREETTFVDCSAFGKTAETINQYCQKGKAIFVEGRLKYDQWEDKQGGGKRSKLSVVIENFQFIGSRDGGSRQADDSSQAPPRQSAQRYQTQRSSPQAPQEAPFPEDDQFKDNDVPF